MEKSIKHRVAILERRLEELTEIDLLKAENKVLMERMEFMRNAITAPLHDSAYRKIDSWFNKKFKALRPDVRGNVFGGLIPCDHCMQSHPAGYMCIAKPDDATPENQDGEIICDWSNNDIGVGELVDQLKAENKVLRARLEITYLQVSDHLPSYYADWFDLDGKALRHDVRGDSDE